MPEPPEGERPLLDLARRFAQAETQVLQLLEQAIDGDRRSLLRRSLSVIAALRLLDAKTLVVLAYLAEHPEGHPDAVRDLAGSLAKRLDQGAQMAAEGSTVAFGKVATGNVDEMATTAVVAAVDARGIRWSLSRWAQVNTQTVGRQATSRGVAYREGEGGRVTVVVGDCEWCQSHAGDAVIGTDPPPPFHPNCSCVASR